MKRILDIMKRTYVLLLVMVLLLAACGRQTQRADASQTPTWQEQYDLGVRYLSEGNYEEAIIAFTAAIEIDPKQPPAYVGRGDAYFGVAQVLSSGTENEILSTEVVSSYENAIADYLAALDLDESLADIYRKAAEIYVVLGDLDSAVGLLERGIVATDDKDLQLYLDKMKAKQSLFVLIREDLYTERYSEIREHHEIFTYDEAGFQVTWDSYTDHLESPWHSVTWSYDEGKNIWIEETTEHGETTTKVVETRQPGTKRYFHGRQEFENYIYSDPYKPYVNENYTVNYTYDEHGNVVRIDTYHASGALSGYCILTWEEIHPIVR